MPTFFPKRIDERMDVWHTGDMTFTHSICATCGTGVVEDDETGVQAHLDITYKNCGIEGEISALADRIESSRSLPTQPRLRLVR